MERRKRIHMGRRRKLRLLLILCTAGIVLGWYILNANFMPALENMTATKIDIAASDAMYEAVLELLEDENSIGPLVHIQTTDNQVLYSRIASERLNLFAAKSAQAAQDYLDAAGKQGISVPLGTVMGVPLLSGHGPEIKVYFTTEGNINSEIKSEFRSAGINQTLHRITVRLIASVAVALPGHAYTLMSDLDVPLAETIIVGAVPNTYADVGGHEELLNLVP